MLQAEPLIRWPQPITEYIGFVGSFLAYGAIGFRYAALRGGPPESTGSTANDGRVYSDSARRAAVIGLVGVILSAILAARALPGLAARRHTTVGGLVTSDFLTAMQLAMLALALIGFALASRRVSVGWPLAAVGAIVGALRAALLGQWSRLVNPIHVLMGGLWIGTLFVLVVAGISAVLRDEPARERRGAIVARMVNNFSPLALACGGVLVLSGLTTAWTHLKYLAALWTTPYGYALIAKLCVVAVVFALGAWNWRRQRPQLGSEGAAVAIRRSARAELMVAGLVLAITSILVSLPSPKKPKAAGATVASPAP